MRIVSVWSFVCAVSPTLNRSDIECCIKGELVGEYVPDLVVQQILIVDTKTIDRITDHERGQMLNYLRITTLPVGIILNFKHARLEWERLVLTNEPKIDRDKDQLIL
jgi:GxxExxY protein